MSDTHAPFLRAAIAAAAQAVKNGNHPFGAVLVVDGTIRVTAENAVGTTHDNTQHAELRLVQAAASLCSRPEMARAVLYTSTEPCAMCAAAIYWAGVRTVVYSCRATTLEDEAEPLHRDFWRR